MSRTAATSIGIIYACYQNGLWAWNGGNSSQKISEAIEDDSFNNTTIHAGAYVDIVKWGDWIVATNDWLMDVNTGGWWKLTPPTDGNPHVFYQTSTDDLTLYACLGAPTSTHLMDFYSKTTPSSTFTWKSYPLLPGSAERNRMLSVQEVVFRVQGNGTVTVVVEGVAGSASTSSRPPSPSRPLPPPASPPCSGCGSATTAAARSSPRTSPSS